MARDERYADLMGAAEALLFVSDEPVGAARLAEILQASPGEVETALVQLAAEYQDENRGMQLREVAGGWRFYTHPAFHDIIERYVVSWDTHRMSQAALEALAVIAYHQPVTRASVNAIRGVNSESVVSSLVEKGLVREMGRDKPGGAILYGTTRAFLERFGLKSVKDLPPLEDFAPDEESREQIRERLSGAGKMPDMQLELTEDEDDVDHAVDAYDLRIIDEDGVAQVQEVDTGDDERIDDAQAMSEVVGQAMTERVDFDIFEFDEDEEDELAGPADDDEDEDDVIDDVDEEDDLIDYADEEEEAPYDRDFDEGPDDDVDADDDDAEDAEDDEIEFVE